MATRPHAHPKPPPQTVGHFLSEMQLGKQRAEVEKILKPTGTHPAVAPNGAELFGVFKEAQGYRSNGAVAKAPNSYKNPGSETKTFTSSDADVVRLTFSLYSTLFIFHVCPYAMPDTLCLISGEILAWVILCGY